MGKNTWILGILVFILILQVAAGNSPGIGHIDGFDGFDSETALSTGFNGKTSLSTALSTGVEGQKSLVTGESIQQDRGKKVDQLNYIICCILVIIIFSVVYISSFIMNGTSMDDIKQNLKSNTIIKLILTGITMLGGVFSQFYNNLGLFLFLMFLFTILIPFYYFFVKLENIIYLIVSLFLIICFGFFYFISNKLIATFKPDEKNYIKNVLLFLFSIGPIIGWFFYPASSLIVAALLTFILIFAIYSELYLKLLKAGSEYLLAISLIFMVCVMPFYGSKSKYTIIDIVISIIPIMLVILYIILFVAHVIYYHGFLLTKNISFLKRFNLPIMDSAKLKKSPVYIFCEGILFEPFYKFWFLKDRIVITDWHKKFDFSNREIVDL